MIDSGIDLVLHFIEVLFGYGIGSTGFNIIVGVCALTWVVVARIFMAMFSSKRGLFAAFLVLVLSFAIGLVAYAMAALYLVPVLEHNWAAEYIPKIFFGVVVVLTLHAIGKRIWELSTGVSLFIYIVATAAAVGAYFGTQVTLGVIEFGEEQVEQRDQRVKDDLEALF